MGDGIILYVDDDSSAVITALCRVCDEGEFESCKSLEAPCACSGTVKFAHRDCIQRWCNEKGNTICELCLQKFEPAFTAPPPKKAQLIDSTETVRESLKIPRRERELEIAIGGGGETVETQCMECSSAVYTSASYCRSVALIFTVLLLSQHMFALLCGGTGGYPFTLLTLLIIRATSILLPMYILIRIITGIQNSIRRQYEDFEGNTISFDDHSNGDEQQLPSI